VTYTHDEIQAHLKRFAESVSSSLQFFTIMFSEKLSKLEAQNDQVAIAVVLDQMEEVLLYVAESATTRKHRQIPEDVVLPCEQRLLRLVRAVAYNEPLARTRAQ
jgi:hypothetical protein